MKDSAAHVLLQKPSALTTKRRAKNYENILREREREQTYNTDLQMGREPAQYRTLRHGLLGLCCLGWHCCCLFFHYPTDLTTHAQRTENHQKKNKEETSKKDCSVSPLPTLPPLPLNSVSFRGACTQSVTVDRVLALTLIITLNPTFTLIHFTFSYSLYERQSHSHKKFIFLFILQQIPFFFNCKTLPQFPTM